MQWAARAYSQDIRCPECGSNQMPKTALPRAARFIAVAIANAITPKGAAYARPGAADGEQALALLGEGISQSAVARIIGVTPPAVCLPEAELYRSDAYAVYRAWLPPDCHQLGKGGPVNWNEGRHSFLRSMLNRPGASDKGVHQ